MYLTSALVGHGTSVSSGPNGAPIECTHGTNSPSEPRTSRAPVPMRVMIRIETTPKGERVTLTPTSDLSAPSRPMEKGTTYIVRPRIEPENSSPIVSRISLGARQLLVGPAASCFSEQMNVQIGRASCRER